MSKLSKLPTSSRAAPLNRLRAFDRFTRDADSVAQRYAELDRIRRIAHDLTPDDAQRAALAKRAALSAYDREVLARCEQALDVFNPLDCYDNVDCAWDLRRDVISLRIATIVGSFPSGAPGDPEVYVGMLIEQVDAVEDLTLPALDSAVREIVATQKFLPAVSEVLTVVNEQNVKWEDRLWAIYGLAEYSQKLVASIASSDRSRGQTTGATERRTP